jgi:HEAT repeat protein
MQQESATTVIAVLFIAAALAAPSPAHAEPTPELVEELRPLVETGLASDDVSVRSWAVRAASLTGERAHIDAVVADLENANAPVRIAAATALIDLDQNREEAEEALVRELVEGDAQSRDVILSRILVQADEDTRLRVLRAALRATSPADVHGHIVRHIAQRGDEPSVALLNRAAELDDAEQRRTWVDAVVRANRPVGLGVARALIGTRDATKRLEGAEIAFALDTLAAREVLTPLLDADDPELAQRVGLHLARHGNVEALSRVKELALNAEMPEADRMEAMAVLRDRGAQLVSWEELQGVLAEEGRTPAFVTRTWELAGATRDPEAISAIRGLLDGLFADQRMLGIAGYGYSGQADGVAVFSEVLGGSGDGALRERAAEALGNLGGDAAAQALIEALRRERVDAIKVAIVRALGKTESPSAALPLANALALQHEEIALAALEGIRKLGDTTVSRQVESAALSFRSHDVRWKATIVLTHLDPEVGRIRLLQALDRPPQGFLDDLAGLPEGLRADIDRRLLEHSDPTLREPALFRAMAAPDGGYAVLRPMVERAGAPDVRRQGISVVTAAGLPEDAALFEALTADADRSIRLQGFGALARLGDPEREEFFRGYLNHADVALRMIAAYALLAIEA